MGILEFLAKFWAVLAAEFLAVLAVSAEFLAEFLTVLAAGFLAVFGFIFAGKYLKQCQGVEKEVCKIAER